MFDMLKDLNIETSTPFNAETYSERAIQNFYMIAERNHIQLSGIADRKANIILAVCSVIISSVLTGSAKIFKSDFDTYFLSPMAIFLVFMVLTMIMSIMTTMPKLSAGTFDKEAVKEHKVNLAFFGNFHKMELKDYEWAVKYMQDDTAEIYKMLTTDLYFLGSVLDRKFRLLNFTYIVLISGVIISIISYIIAYYIRFHVA